MEPGAYVDLIVNWLWQGCAITAVVAIALRALPRLSASSRYRVWAIALIGVLALPALPSLRAVDAVIVPADLASAAVAYDVPLPELPWWPFALVAGVWATHAAWVAQKIARAVLYLRRAKRRARRMPAHLEARLARWTTLRGSGRAARLVISRDVYAASVLGFGTPAIAIAPAALRSLSVDEVEKVVLHEWAHIQRRDDIARLFLLILRAVAGLHPAVWWIGRQMDVERETACDDWAINLTGSPRTYALCLTKLASLPGRRDDATLSPAALWTPDLTRRVLRLLDTRRSTTTTRSLVVTSAALPAIVVAALLLSRVELVATIGTPDLRLPDVAAAQVARPPDTTAGSRAAAGGLRPDEEPARPAAGQRPPKVRSTARSPLPEALPASDAGARATQPPVPERPVAPPLPAPVADDGAVRELPGATSAVGAVPAPPTATTTAAPPPSPEPPGRKTATPWGAAADAGVNLGRGSQKAATATAGFFSRLGKSIAGSF
jgi:beta-lactamase regulating signal transducer with metallopeptidase domain